MLSFIRSFEHTLCAVGLFVTVALLVPSAASSSEKHALTIPGEAGDERGSYERTLLLHALSYSGKQYSVGGYAGNLPKARNFKNLISGQGLDVVWSMTRPDREANTLPIRIPLFKGLYGWRVALLRAEDKEQFKKLESFEQLQALKAGQHFSWTDTKILKHNKLGIVTGSSYSSLFGMLQAKRFDYFPRSVAEAYREAEQHKDKDLHVDDSLIIHYPAAMYYFVNKNNSELAQDITQGLEKAIADGSFDELFESFNREALAKLKPETRRVVRLENPLLPPMVPVHRPELWLELPARELSWHDSPSILSPSN